MQSSSSKELVAGLCRVVAESPSLVTDQGANCPCDCEGQIAPWGTSTHLLEDICCLKFLMPVLRPWQEKQVGPEMRRFHSRRADLRDQKTMTRSSFSLTLSLSLVSDFSAKSFCFAVAEDFAAFVVRSVFFGCAMAAALVRIRRVRQGNGNGTESPLSMVALAAEQPIAEQRPINGPPLQKLYLVYL